MRKEPPMNPEAVARLVKLLETREARAETAAAVSQGGPHSALPSPEVVAYQTERDKLRERCIAIHEEHQAEHEWSETVSRFMTFRKERRTHYGEETKN